MLIIEYLSTKVQVAYDLESTSDLHTRSDAEVLTELLVNTYIYNLIITTTKPNSAFHKSGRITTLPPLSPLTHITQLSIRYLNISESIPAFPPNLLILDLFYTSIHVLDNLPHSLKILQLSNNSNLIKVFLPNSLTSLEVKYQYNIDTLTLPESIVYLRLYECRINRINRFTLNTIQSCITPRQCVIRCVLPYVNLEDIQYIIPYTPNPTLIFHCINKVNRSFDENITSIFYRLRETSLYSTASDPYSPITKALRLASNTPRRFSEFIVDYLV